MPIVFVVLLACLVVWLRFEVVRRRRVELALKYQTELQAMVMNAVPTPLLVQDEQGRYLAVNPAFEESVGLSADELIGRKVSEAGRLDALEWQKLAVSLQAVFATGEPVNGLLYFRALDDERREARFWVRACVNASTGRREAVLAAFLDVSDQRRMAQREVELKQQLVELTQSVPLAIFQLVFQRSTGLRLAFVNEPAYGMLGVPHVDGGEILRLFGNRMLPRERRGIVRRLLRNARNGLPTDLEWVFAEPQHDLEAVRIVAVPGRAACGAHTWSGYVLDISDSRRRNIALSLAKRDAEAASAAKDTLLATVSHELRTPLSGVVSILELLDCNALSAANRGLVGTARTAADILTSILDDILTYSTAMRGELAMRASCVSVERVAREIADLVAPTAHKKGLALRVNVSPSLKPTHVADPKRIGQILLNLLGNSVKFTERGHVALDITTRDHGDMLQNVAFSVSDTGIGIAPAQQARVFEPFVQARQGGRDYGGAGLGLAITRALVEAMGGAISVSGQVGRGTTMVVELPLQWHRHAAEPVPASNPPDVHALPPHDGTVSHMHVLIVEDVALNRDLLSLQLSRIGMTCDMAASGEEALRLLETRHYRAVITDCTMPGMSGVELIAQIRSLPGHDDTALYALTANATASLRQACLNAGADGVLIKPVGLDDLRKVLASATGRDRGLERARDARSFQHNDTLRRRLLQGLHELLDALNAAPRDKPADAAMLQDLAHRAAGMGAWFGIDALAQAGRALEDQIDAGHAAPASVAALETSIHEAIASLAAPATGAGRNT
jgi:PAS domain S-box-containing protein